MIYVHADCKGVAEGQTPQPPALTVSKYEYFDPLKRDKNSVLDQKTPVLWTHLKKFTKKVAVRQGRGQTLRLA